MDIFFTDSSEAPLPPNEVRIRSVKAEPWPDGRRVKVTLEVDPFQRRPSMDLTVFDLDGREVASASIIESMTRKMEMNLHLRSPEPGEFTLKVSLYYGAVHEPGEDPETNGAVEQTIVDSAAVTFRTGGA